MSRAPPRPYVPSRKGRCLRVSEGRGHGRGDLSWGKSSTGARVQSQAVYRPGTTETLVSPRLERLAWLEFSGLDTE